MKCSRGVRAALRISVLVLALVPTQLGQAQMSGQFSVLPPSGMVGWWPGDGNANDISGFSNNGTLVNGASFGAGEVGQAFLLNGSGQYVDAGNSSSLQVSSGDFTVDAWVNFNAIGGDMSIVDKSTSFPNRDGWRLIKQADNRFWFCFGGGPANRCYDPAYTIFSTTVATTGVWYHVAVVKTSSAFSIYVNGVLEDTRSPVPAFFDSNTADLLLGATGQAYPAYLNGLIDEVELFNRALTPSEIQSIFNARSAGKCKRVCFATFVVNKMDINVASSSFDMTGTFTLSKGSLSLPIPNMTIQVGGYTTTIPAGSFTQNKQGFVYQGVINGVALQMVINHQSGSTYAFKFQATGALPATANPVPVGLTIGVNDTGSTTVTNAQIQ